MAYSALRAVKNPAAYVTAFGSARTSTWSAGSVYVSELGCRSTYPAESWACSHSSMYRGSVPVFPASCSAVRGPSAASAL